MITDDSVVPKKYQEFSFSCPAWSGDIKDVFVGEKVNHGAIEYSIFARVMPNWSNKWEEVEFTIKPEKRIESGISPVEVARLWIIPHFLKNRLSGSVRKSIGGRTESAHHKIYTPGGAK